MRATFLTVAAALFQALSASNVAATACSSELSDWQADQFRAAVKAKGQWTACGEKLWMTRFNELAEAGDRVVYDIGCNKGYESALFFELFAPGSGMTAGGAYDVHKASGMPLTGDLCGVCGNCKERIDPGNGVDVLKHKHVHVYCFEPSQLNFVALSTVYAKFQGKMAEHKAHWHLVNTAVGNGTMLVQFPKECGSTLCSLHSAGTKEGLGAAFMTSVDDFTEAEGLDFIDVLKIDTEGNDPAVLMGATNVLRNKKVGIVYFEYNYMGMWKTHNLEDIVTNFDSMDYVCYFEGSPTLTRLTQCWHDSYEFRGWSNVVCVQRSHFMYEEMERMAFVHEKHSERSHRGL